MESAVKRLGIYTSGGDAPGMNAAIRAAVRTASHYDLHVYGIKRGYAGMIAGEIGRLEARDVGNIILRGGTMLRTARSEEFMTSEGREKAYNALAAHNIQGLLAIGGNGTLTGAKIFGEEYNIPIIGLPGTIDNDLYGTDYTIGFDTSVNTAIDAIDKIRDTADSHNRVFFIEVMGRHSGYIALHTGIGVGAGSILIPETDTNIERLCDKLRKNIKRNKLFSIIIVAEGDEAGGAVEISEKVQRIIPEIESRVTIIGHLQRGGSPTAQDRFLASRMGFSAVEGIMNGHRGEMVGIVNNEINFVSFEEAISNTKTPDDDLLRMAEILAV